MLNRRQVLHSLGALPILAAGQPRLPSRKADPRMGFLGFGPVTEEQRIEAVRSRVREYGKRYGFQIEPLRVAQLEEDSLEPFAGFFVYGAGTLEFQRGSKVESADSNGRREFSAVLSEKAMRRLGKAIKRGGRGLVAIHGAAGISPSHGVRSRNQARRSAWVSLLGGESIGSHSAQNGHVRMADRSVPGMASLRAGFDLEERWLSFKNFDPGIHVIMVQETATIEGSLYERPPYPMSWLHYHGKGRVFYTALGYEAAAWETDVLRRSVVGGALWVLRDTEADVSANLMRVTPNAIQAVYPV